MSQLSQYDAGFHLNRARQVVGRMRTAPRIGGIAQIAGHLLNATVVARGLSDERREKVTREIREIDDELPKLKRAAYIAHARKKFGDLLDYSKRSRTNNRTHLLRSAYGQLMYSLNKAEATPEDIGTTAAALVALRDTWKEDS